MSLKQLKCNVALGYLRNTTSGILMRPLGSIASIINITNKSTVTFNKYRNIIAAQHWEMCCLCYILVISSFEKSEDSAV